MPFNVPVPHASGQSSVALVPPLSASAAAAVGVDALLLRSTVDDEYSFFDPRLVAALTKRAWMGPGAGGLAAAAGHWKVGVRFSARQKVPGGELLADTQTAYKKGDSSKVKKRFVLLLYFPPPSWHLRRKRTCRSSPLRLWECNFLIIICYCVGKKKR